MKIVFSKTESGLARTANSGQELTKKHRIRQIVTFFKPVAEEVISPFFSPDDLEERSKDKKKMNGEDEDGDELDDGNGENKDKKKV